MCETPRITYLFVRWQAPAPNNSAITGYEVSYNGQVATYGAGAAGITQRIAGLANGTAYTFAVRAINGIGASEWSAGTTVTPYGTPTAPRSVSITASGTAPADLTLDWAAPDSTGGGSVRYEWRVNNGGWTTTTATSARVNNVGAGTYRLDVRATNVGGGGVGPIASDTVGVSDPPPPQPGGSIFKGSISPTSCSGCRYVGIDYHDFPAGSYRITTFINGSNAGLTENSYSLNSNGSVVIWNSLGIRNNDRIQVRFVSNANGNVYWSDPITNWDSLPIRGGTP